MVVDPVYPRVNCCARRSFRRGSLRTRAGKGFGGGVGGDGGDRCKSCWLLVSCGDGSGSKGFSRRKGFHGSIFLEPLLPQHVSWEVFFTDRNEQRPAPQ